MATARPSFLKRQKEQARLARANEKRAARLERKRSGGGPPIGSLEDLGVTDTMTRSVGDDVRDDVESGTAE